MTTGGTEGVLRFYRCVEKYPLELIEFVSKQALGEEMRPPHTAQRQRIWAGLSVYSDREAAIDRARHLTPPRPYLAVLQVPPDSPVTYEQTGKTPAHYTLWASLKDLQECVLLVVEIASGSPLDTTFSTSEQDYGS